MTHYYDEHPDVASNEDDVLVHLDKDAFYVTTDAGVFAKDGLDPASELLIESVTPRESFLDLGCGYGVIGVAFLRRGPDLRGVFVDVNSRAVRLTRRNLDRYDLDGDVVQGEGYEPVSERFSDIVCNPPFAAGKETWHGFIDDAPSYLEEGGRLSMVARHNKGGGSVRRRMKDVFGEVNDVAKSGGYRVYQSTL